MKKLWIMAWAELAVTALALFLFLTIGACRPAVLLPAAGLVLQGFLLAEIKKHQNIQKFLLMESKKKNSQKI